MARMSLKSIGRVTKWTRQISVIILGSLFWDSSQAASKAEIVPNGACVVNDLRHSIGRARPTLAAYQILEALKKANPGIPDWTPIQAALVRFADELNTAAAARAKYLSEVHGESGSFSMSFDGRNFEVGISRDRAPLRVKFMARDYSDIPTSLQESSTYFVVKYRPFKNIHEIFECLNSDCNIPRIIESSTVYDRKVAAAFGIRPKGESIPQGATILEIPDLPGYHRVIQHPDKTLTLFRGVNGLMSGSDPLTAFVPRLKRSLPHGALQFLQADFKERHRLLTAKFKDRMPGGGEYFVGTSIQRSEAEKFGNVLVTLEVPEEAVLPMIAPDHYMWSGEQEWVVPFYVHPEWVKRIEKDRQLIYNSAPASQTISHAQVKLGMVIDVTTRSGRRTRGKVIRIDSMGWWIQETPGLSSVVVDFDHVPDNTVLLIH